MKIKNELPPNYDEIKKYFPSADFNKGTLFTYGDTCYCQSITPDLVVHEETHVKQQLDPKAWWDRYFTDIQFRLSQEVEAYRNQWQWIKKNIKDRNSRFRLLSRICMDLSGTLYGNIVSFDEAKRLIEKV